MMTFLAIFAAGSCAVVDSDTIRCHGERIRLARVNAPELSQPGGREAADWMRMRVEGQQVICTFSGREKFGRLLGECFAGEGLSLSDQLLAAGMAVPYRGRR